MRPVWISKRNCRTRKALWRRVFLVQTMPSASGVSRIENHAQAIIAAYLQAMTKSEAKALAVGILIGETAAPADVVAVISQTEVEVECVNPLSA